MMKDNVALDISGYTMTLVDTGDLETLRRIRNNCKEFMTNNSNHINRNQQIDWYRNLDKSSNLVYLFHIEHLGTRIPAGYGIIKKTTDKAWLTVGLVSQYRNKGLARILFGELIKISAKDGKKPVIEVFKKNVRAIRLYEKIGFSYTGEKEKVFIMEYK